MWTWRIGKEQERFDLEVPGIGGSSLLVAWPLQFGGGDRGVL